MLDRHQKVFNDSKVPYAVHGCVRNFMLVAFAGALALYRFPDSRRAR